MLHFDAERLSDHELVVRENYLPVAVGVIQESVLIQLRQEHPEVFVVVEDCVHEIVRWVLIGAS